MPIHTPDEIIAKIEAAAVKAMASEKAKAFAQSNGAQIYWKNRAETEAQISRDIETFNALASE